MENLTLLVTMLIPQDVYFGVWPVLAKDVFKQAQDLLFFQAVTICKDPYLDQECTGISISKHLFWVDCGVAAFLLTQYPNVYSGLPCMLHFIKPSGLAALILHWCQGFYKLPQTLNAPQRLATYDKPHRVGNCSYSNFSSRGLKQKGQRRP